MHALADGCTHAWCQTVSVTPLLTGMGAQQMACMTLETCVAYPGARKGSSRADTNSVGVSMLGIQRKPLEASQLLSTSVKPQEGTTTASVKACTASGSELAAATETSARHASQATCKCWHLAV